MTLFWQVTHSITIESTYTILARYALTLERMLLKVKIKNENGRVSKTSWINDNVIFKWVTSIKTATLCHCLKLQIRRGGSVTYLSPPYLFLYPYDCPPPTQSHLISSQFCISPFYALLVTIDPPPSSHRYPVIPKKNHPLLPPGNSWWLTLKCTFQYFINRHHVREVCSRSL